MGDRCKTMRDARNGIRGRQDGLRQIRKMTRARGKGDGEMRLIRLIGATTVFLHTGVYCPMLREDRKNQKKIPRRQSKNNRLSRKSRSKQRPRSRNSRQSRKNSKRPRLRNRNNKLSPKNNSKRRLQSRNSRQSRKNSKRPRLRNRSNKLSPKNNSKRRLPNRSSKRRDSSNSKGSSTPPLQRALSALKRKRLHNTRNRNFA